MHVVKLYKINEFQFWETQGQPSLFGEAMIAFFCHPCSLAQIARHVYGYDKSVYFDGDSRIDREDQWLESDSTGLLKASDQV